MLNHDFSLVFTIFMIWWKINVLNAFHQEKFHNYFFNSKCRVRSWQFKIFVVSKQDNSRQFVHVNNTCKSRIKLFRSVLYINLENQLHMNRIFWYWAWPMCDGGRSWLTLCKAQMSQCTLDAILNVNVNWDNDFSCSQQ